MSLLEWKVQKKLLKPKVKRVYSIEYLGVLEEGSACRKEDFLFIPPPFIFEFPTPVSESEQSR
jgi:hypothetical protein